MRKIALIFGGIVIVSILALISPFVYHAFKISGHRRALQSRTDYPQIAIAWVLIAQSMTNENTLIKPTDPIVPGLLRSLSPRYISASSNYVTMEFHGGFDHYGYNVRQSDTNPKQWTISWYTEKSQRILTTISHD